MAKTGDGYHDPLENADAYLERIGVARVRAASLDYLDVTAKVEKHSQILERAYKLEQDMAGSKAPKTLLM